MNKENCALKLVDEIILYYDARQKKHQIYLHVSQIIISTCVAHLFLLRMATQIISGERTNYDVCHLEIFSLRQKLGRDSAGVIEIRRGSEQQRNSIPGRGKDFFRLQSSSVDNGGAFLLTGWPGREADNSHLIVSKLKLEELYLHTTLYHHVYDQERICTSYVEIVFSSLMLKHHILCCSHNCLRCSDYNSYFLLLHSRHHDPHSTLIPHPSKLY